MGLGPKGSALSPLSTRWHDVGQRQPVVAVAGLSPALGTGNACCSELDRLGRSHGIRGAWPHDACWSSASSSCARHSAQVARSANNECCQQWMALSGTRWNGCTTASGGLSAHRLNPKLGASHHFTGRTPTLSSVLLRQHEVVSVSTQRRL